MFNGIQKETVEVNIIILARYTGFIPSEVLLSVWVYYPDEISRILIVN